MSQSISDPGIRRAAEPVYPPAYEAIRPFFNARTQWGGTGSQEVLAYHTLRDHFPELNAQDIFLVIVTARRLFRNGLDTP